MKEKNERQKNIERLINLSWPSLECKWCLFRLPALSCFHTVLGIPRRTPLVLSVVSVYFILGNQHFHAVVNQITSPLCLTLHWLPIVLRIKYKLSTNVVYEALHDLISPHHSLPCSLCSSHFLFLKPTRHVPTPGPLH